MCGFITEFAGITLCPFHEYERQELKSIKRITELLDNMATLQRKLDAKFTAVAKAVFLGLNVMGRLSREAIAYHK